MNAITVSLPWPPAECSPNWRGHWAKRSRAVSNAEEIAWMKAYESWGDRGLDQYDNPDYDLYIRYTFHPPDKRKRDLDNFISRCKPYVDGLFEYLLADDSAIKRTEAAWGSVVKGGEVVITIGVIQDDD